MIQLSDDQKLQVLLVELQERYNCHRELLYEVRQQVAWLDVKGDMAALSQADRGK